MPEIKRFGDRGILVNFAQQIDPDINELVIQLDEDLRQSLPNEIQYTIPAYCSLTIQYDPDLISFAAIKSTLSELLNQEKRPATVSQHREITVPVCYDVSLGWDLAELSQELDLSIEGLIKLHTTQIYRVYMLGFLPGFVYMGKLPTALQCRRKTTPRLRVPQGSVAIAGFQTGIYPSEGPGGWNIIGQTPLPPLRPRRSDPFLFRAGDQVRFEDISLAEYGEITKQLEAGTYELKIAYV